MPRPEHQVAPGETRQVCADAERRAQRVRLHAAVAGAGTAAGVERLLHQPRAVQAIGAAPAPEVRHAQKPGRDGGGIVLEPADGRQVMLHQPARSMHLGEPALARLDEDQAVQKQAVDDGGLDRRLMERQRRQGADTMGRRRPGVAQGVGLDPPRITVPFGLAEGEAVPRLQRRERLAEQQLIHLFGVGCRTFQNPCARAGALHRRRQPVEGRGNQTLHIGGGRIVQQERHSARHQL